MPFAVCKNCLPSGVSTRGRLRTNSEVSSSSSSFAICLLSDCCDMNRCFAASEKLFSSATAIKLLSIVKSIFIPRPPVSYAPAVFFIRFRDEYITPPVNSQTRTCAYLRARNRPKNGMFLHKSAQNSLKIHHYSKPPVQSYLFCTKHPRKKFAFLMQIVNSAIYYCKVKLLVVLYTYTRA